MGGMPIYGPAEVPRDPHGNRRWSRRQRRKLRGSTSEPLAGPAGLPPDVLVHRRRIRERRRSRRSTAFDLLAVAAALVLVLLGLENLYLVGGPQIAARQGLIAAGGVLALAAFWRVRTRYLGVLGWIAY